MKQWRRRILLCVSLGFVTTVAVAWLGPKFQRVIGLGPAYESRRHIGQTCAYVLQSHDWVSAEAILAIGPPNYMGPRDEYPRYVAEMMAQGVAAASTASDFPPMWGRRPASSEIPSNAETVWYAQKAQGWPLRAFWWESSGYSTLYSAVDSTLHHGAWVLGRSRPVLVLPFRPFWVGLSVDSAFFAGAWAVALYAPRAIRARFRRGRNLCLHCGYNRAGLATNVFCPECGKGAP